MILHFKTRRKLCLFLRRVSHRAQNPTVQSSSSTPVVPQEQEFHQHLCALARRAVRVVREEVMREELDQFLGVAWAERSPKRKGHRNGAYTRDLVTSSGRLQDIKVPRDREGQFHTQTFERYRSSEPHLAEGRDGDVRGWHEHPQGGGSRPNPAGSRSQWKSRSVASTRR